MKKTLLLRFFLCSCAVNYPECEPYFATELWDRCIDDAKFDRQYSKMMEEAKHRAMVDYCKSQKPRAVLYCTSSGKIDLDMDCSCLPQAGGIR